MLFISRETRDSDADLVSSAGFVTGSTGVDSSPISLAMTLVDRLLFSSPDLFVFVRRPPFVESNVALLSRDNRGVSFENFHEYFVASFNSKIG